MIRFLAEYWIEVALIVWMVGAVWLVARAVRRQAPWLLDEGAGRGSVRAGSDGVTWVRGQRSATVAWADVAAVTVRTTSDGPLADDLFLDVSLTSGAGDLSIPSEADGFGGLVEALAHHLPGFDAEGMLEATTSFEDFERVLWTRDGEARRRRPGGGRIVSLVVAALATHAVSGCAQQPVAETLASLPVVSYEQQCASGACDHAVEERVFAVLDSLGAASLRRNLPVDGVRRTWGEPSRYLAPLDFEDVRFGNRVTIWTYAVSLSGTVHYVLVFANGCLDLFGREQASDLYARYGRPGWTGDSVEAYRFRSPPTSPCGAA